MKRLGIAVAVAALLVVGTVAMVTAQTPNNDWRPGWGCGMGGWGAGANGGAAFAGNPMLSTIAGKLGIGVDELVKELQSGKSVMDVAVGKATKDELIAALQAPQSEMMDIQVKYGRLTAEQATQMKDLMAQRWGTMLEQDGWFGGAGRGQGFGPRGGMMGPGNGPANGSGLRPDDGARLRPRLGRPAVGTKKPQGRGRGGGLRPASPSHVPLRPVGGWV